MAVENVQIQRSHHRITHGILLIQKSRIGSFFDIVPRSPFVYDQFYFMLRIVFAHNIQMAFDHRLDTKCRFDRLIISLFIKTKCMAFFLPASRNGIIVHTDCIGKLIFDQAHHLIRPVKVIRIWSTADLIQFVVSVIAAVCLVTAVHISIKFRCHVAAAAPVFVSYAKIFYFPRFFSSIFLTQFCHRRFTVKGHILDPF